VVAVSEKNYILLNTAVPPLNDVRVRQALAYTTDRRRAVSTLYHGITTPADGPFTPGSPYFGPTGYPSFDPDRARALVAAYQHDRGPISFTLASVNTGNARQRNELLQAMWKEVGIQGEIVEVEQAALIVDALVGRYQAVGWRQFNAVDPDANFVWWSSTTSAPIGRQALNFARNADSLLDAALQAGRTQVDPQVRAACYRLAASRLGADVPYIWIAPSVWIVAAHDSVGGLGRATLPDGGDARGMISGVVSTAELWRAA